MSVLKIKLLVIVFLISDGEDGSSTLIFQSTFLDLIISFLRRPWIIFKINIKKINIHYQKYYYKSQKTFFK